MYIYIHTHVHTYIYTVFYIVTTCHSSDSINSGAEDEEDEVFFGRVSTNEVTKTLAKIREEKVVHVAAPSTKSGFKTEMIDANQGEATNVTPPQTKKLEISGYSCTTAPPQPLEGLLIDLNSSEETSSPPTNTHDKEVLCLYQAPAPDKPPFSAVGENNDTRGMAESTVDVKSNTKKGAQTSDASLLKPASVLLPSFQSRLAKPSMRLTAFNSPARNVFAQPLTTKTTAALQKDPDTVFTGKSGLPQASGRIPMSTATATVSHSKNMSTTSSTTTTATKGLPLTTIKGSTKSADKKLMLSRLFKASCLAWCDYIFLVIYIYFL